jgi:hypothetical protein
MMTFRKMAHGWLALEQILYINIYNSFEISILKQYMSVFI